MCSIHIYVLWYFNTQGGRAPLSASVNIESPKYQTGVGEKKNNWAGLQEDLTSPGQGNALFCAPAWRQGLYCCGRVILAGQLFTTHNSSTREAINAVSFDKTNLTPACLFHSRYVDLSLQPMHRWNEQHLTMFFILFKRPSKPRQSASTRRRVVKLEHLTGSEPSFTLLITPAFFILSQVTMPAVKKVYCTVQECDMNHLEYLRLW